MDFHPDIVLPICISTIPKRTRRPASPLSYPIKENKIYNIQRKRRLAIHSLGFTIMKLSKSSMLSVEENSSR